MPGSAVRSAPAQPVRWASCVGKVCVYPTRNDTELLVFEGPNHKGLQIPKGTIEPDETPREALYRELIEETGVATVTGVAPIVTDVWKRYDTPPKFYTRHFYHARVHEPRDAWTHTVTGTGDERGTEFACSWVDLPTDAGFALDLDDYLSAIPLDGL